MRERTVTIRLVEPDTNALMCIACARFQCEYAVQVADGEPQVGLHKKCLPSVRAHRAPRKSANGTSERAGTEDAP